ncbi:MAG: DNA-3-methyladenine glycosylase I [Alphaproteobacteria bacterium]|nr:DNA-3-methyladenine glycosylase I [Alphaproteobacteria bacterium]OJV16253.1 MAG: DNA-3-methyladenine glycosylase [Alphaproteobacteria bacterium 33-17]
MTNRCAWVNLNNKEYIEYHDNEWGVPVHDDRKHFEMLILEGAQAGLSWETVLKKREEYRKVFHNFDVDKTIRMTDLELEKLLENPGIIRNRLKVFSVRKNAIAFRQIQQEYKSFDSYIWSYVNNKTIDNKLKDIKLAISKSDISDKISKDLKKRGMSFVGSTIIYAYMQAIGMVNDHTVDCEFK